MLVKSNTDFLDPILVRRASKELDCETAALLRATIRPVFDTAASWSSLADILKEKGYGTFYRFMQAHKDGGRSSLRRAQWRTAMDGNPTMQVWLGKNWLSQADKQSVDLTAEVNQVSKIEHIIVRPKSTDPDR